MNGFDYLRRPAETSFHEAGRRARRRIARYDPSPESRLVFAFGVGFVAGIMLSIVLALIAGWWLSVG